MDRDARIAERSGDWRRRAVIAARSGDYYLAHSIMVSGLEREHRFAANALQAAKNAVSKRQSDEYLEAGGCPQCFGQGWIRHFDTEYACGGSAHKNGKRVPQFAPKTTDEEAARVRILEQQAAAAKTELDLWSKQEPDKGDSVEYYNPRARARWQETRELLGATLSPDDEEPTTGDRVPVGTCGTVIWKGRTRDWHSWNSTASVARVGVRTEDGRAFFTSIKNVRLVNPWHKTIESKEINRRLLTFLPQRDDRVRHGEKEGIVFWVGYRRNDPNTLRVGFRTNTQETVWANAHEVEKA